MWPQRGEAIDRTIAVEAAVADLYAEALRRWAPTARDAVLPALTAAGGDLLPPDPEALAAVQGAWDAIAQSVIEAGLSMVWSVAYVEAAEALGIDVPATAEGSDADAAAPELDPVAVQIVAATTDADARRVADDLERVRAVPQTREAMADFVDTQREQISSVPAIVREKLTAAITNLAVDATVSAVAPAREAAVAVLDAASTDMRDVARGEGYQAASVLNHAIIAAAANSTDASELDKCWISTLDGRTRRSHWAADGQRAPLNGKFLVGGEHLEYPGDPKASAAERKNCRCRVGVLAQDEAIPDEVDRHTERLDGRDSVAINRNGRTQAEEIRRRADEGNIRARDDPEGVGTVAAAGWEAPSEQENDMRKGQAFATTDAADGAETDAETDAETYLTFTDALFAVTGVPTSDGRMLAADIDLTFRETPLPLQWCEEMEGGHYGSVTVGVIESITLKDGEVRASGYMLNNENALKAIDLVSHGVCNPSVDLGNAEIIATDPSGVIITEDNYSEDIQVCWTTVKAEVLATTIVAIPAFGQTRIALNEQRETRDKTLVAAIVASAAEQYQPRVYAPELFADPKLTGPTHLTITEDGHIFGHVAVFSERHRSVGLGHISPPRSKTGYEHFHSSPPVHLSDGTKLPVGRLTVGTGHAPTTGVSNAAAQAHYDNTGHCFALVRAGEDKFGIWVSGVAAPWATQEQIEMGLSSPLSGDWRPYNGNLELVAVLSVNTPGFLCRGTTDSRGLPTSLVASLGPSSVQTAGGVGHLSREDIKSVVKEAMAESARAAERAAKAQAALSAAYAAVGEPPAEPTPGERIAALLENVR